MTGGGRQFTNGQRQKKTGHSTQSAAFEGQHRESPQRSRRSRVHQNQWLHAFFLLILLTVSILIAGVEKLMRTYSGNPSFSNQKNLEDTEQQLDEVGQRSAERTRTETAWKVTTAVVVVVVVARSALWNWTSFRPRTTSCLRCCLNWRAHQNLHTSSETLA